jgi:hypothetical protein
MGYVEYGGIQKYGQLLSGWMEYGVLGSQIIVPLTPLPTEVPTREKEWAGGRIKILMDDRNFLDLVIIVVQKGII